MRIFLFCLLATFSLRANEPVTLPVAVIGSGPAGLSAALVTGRDRIDTHVFQGPMLGGPVNAVTCLGNWPAAVKGKGDVVMSRLLDQMEKFSVNLRNETIERVDFSDWPFRLYTTEGNEYLALTVVVATGAMPRRLGAQGETLYQNDIETYIYHADAPRFEGKTIAVVGGGLDAVKKATILAETAEKVYLLVRGDRLQRPFMKNRVETKGNGKVEILYNTTVNALEGDGEKLTHLELSTENGAESLSVDHLVLAAGIIPNSELFEGELPLDEKGFVVVEGRSQKTSIPGVFAAGNVTDPNYRQAAISSGDGMKAGYDVVEYLTQIRFAHAE